MNINIKLPEPRNDYDRRFKAMENSLMRLHKMMKDSKGHKKMELMEKSLKSKTGQIMKMMQSMKKQDGVERVNKSIASLENKLKRQQTIIVDSGRQVVPSPS